jgi:hypothetical protein
VQEKFSTRLGRRLWRHRFSRLIVVFCLAATSALGITLVASPAQAAGSCGGYPFGWRVWDVSNLPASTGQIQVFTAPNDPGTQFIVRFANGPGQSIQVLGAEVGYDDNHTAYGSTTNISTYPQGWCSNASGPAVRTRIAITYRFGGAQYYVLRHCDAFGCSPG